MSKPTKPLAKDNRDNLVSDLFKVIDGLDLSASTHDILMQRLVIYCSERDNQIWQHAYKLGQQSMEPEVDPDEEQ